MPRESTVQFFLKTTLAATVKVTLHFSASDRLAETGFISNVTRWMGREHIVRSPILDAPPFSESFHKNTVNQIDPVTKFIR